MNKEIIGVYFPYKLKVVETKTYNKFFTVKRLEADHYLLEDYWETAIRVSYESRDYIPVLYPLGLLDSVLKYRNCRLNPLDLIGKLLSVRSPVLRVNEKDVWFRTLIMEFLNDQSSLPFTHKFMRAMYRVFLSLHFDLDQLIEKGEALDVTGLNWNPYEFEDFDFTKLESLTGCDFSSRES